MMNWFAPNTRYCAPSSIAPSPQARFANCCATHSASSGNMPSVTELAASELLIRVPSRGAVRHPTDHVETDLLQQPRFRPKSESVTPPGRAITWVEQSIAYPDAAVLIPTIGLPDHLG
jgi:hypothetical protein